MQKYEERLADDDFSKGPEPSKELQLMENQILPINFRGNIISVEEDKLEFVYNSNSSERLYFEVKVKDYFLSKHRGMVIINSKSFERREILDEGSRENDDISRKSILEEKEERICEIQVELPKVI